MKSLRKPSKRITVDVTVKQVCVLGLGTLLVACFGSDVCLMQVIFADTEEADLIGPCKYRM